MWEAADPGYGALDAKAEAGVLERAVAAKIHEPGEIRFFQLMLGDFDFQDVEVVLALAAADDLAVAFGREQIAAHRLAWLLRIFLHVKGFHRRRIMVNENGTVMLGADDRFVGA